MYNHQLPAQSSTTVARVLATPQVNLCQGNDRLCVKQKMRVALCCITDVQSRLEYSLLHAGILFQLDASTFKTVVAANREDGNALIKTLRSIQLLQALPFSQLEQLAQIMLPVSNFFFHR